MRELTEWKYKNNFRCCTATWPLSGSIGSWPLASQQLLDFVSNWQDWAVSFYFSRAFFAVSAAFTLSRECKKKKKGGQLNFRPKIVSRQKTRGKHFKLLVIFKCKTLTLGIIRINKGCIHLVLCHFAPCFWHNTHESHSFRHNIVVPGRGENCI